MLKRINYIVVIIVGVIIMSSCTSLQDRIARLLMTSDEKAANKCYEQVVKALEKQDKEAIRGMFSKQALEEAENFDENLDRLFEIFDGELKPYKKGLYALRITGFEEDITTDKKRTPGIYIAELEK